MKHSLRVLRGEHRKRAACEACGKVVTLGARHGNRGSWCPGFVPLARKRATSLYVAAVRALAQEAMYGAGPGLLEAASAAALRALGVDPASVPLLERWRNT